MLLLDSHVRLWYLDTGPDLRTEVRTRIDTEPQVFVSVASHSRRRRRPSKINDLPHLAFVKIKSIESTTYAFYAASNAASFALTY